MSFQFQQCLPTSHGISHSYRKVHAVFSPLLLQSSTLSNITPLASISRRFLEYVQHMAIQGLAEVFSSTLQPLLKITFFYPVYLFSQKLLSETLPDAPVFKITLKSHLGSLIFPPSPFLPYPVFLLLSFYLFIKMKYLQN